MAPVASSPSAVPPATAAIDKKVHPRERFQAVYTVLLDYLLADFRKQNVPEEAIEYYRNVINYNVPDLGGKLNRGLSVVDSVAILKGRELTESEYFQAAVVGWFVAWLQAHFHITDDVEDASITRCGRPCWYRVEGVGLNAINDAFTVRGGIFQMIRKYFRKEPFFADLIDLIREVLYRTEIRQPVERRITPEGSVNLSKFNLERYRTTDLYRTTMYSFYLPVALALVLCGFPIETKNESDPDYYKIALDILLPLGEYSQIQDDYLDYVGTPERIDKLGSDIMNNKYSWCINTALALASPAQRAILDANYGRKDAEVEEQVKRVFWEVGVDTYYAQYEAETYTRINELIDAVPEVKSRCGEAVLLRALFRMFLEKIHKRTK